MTSKHLTTLNLEPFLRNSIGITDFMNSMHCRIEHANAGNYPPYNIIAVDEDNYLIELAVAGLDRDDISVSVDNGQLTIASKGIYDKATKSELAREEKNYIHRGISSRRFERTFELTDHLEVNGATVVNGILNISLERNIPENLKPKTIEIK